MWEPRRGLNNPATGTSLEVSNTSVGMRKPHLIAIVLLALAAAAPSHAQKVLQSKLPDRFGPWVASTPAAEVKLSGQDAALLSEAGMEQWSTRPYANGPQTIHVSLKRFRDPTGAYEAYTAGLDPELQPSTVGAFTAIGHGRLVMLIGNVLMEVNQPELASNAELRELASAVQKFADATPLPPIRGYLPAGFLDGTQRYTQGPAGFRAALDEVDRGEFAALTDEIGFGLGAEAILARYQRGKESGALLLIEYPTPSLAEQHLRHLEVALSPAAKQAGTTVERKASLLSLVLKPSSAAFGESLRNALRYETEVTWNEPTHKITDPPWLVIVGRIIILTLLFMGLTVAVGAAFGGVRVLLKTLFPGKIFDRPGQMDVLQLGISGKRIDSRDFY